MPRKNYTSFTVFDFFKQLYNIYYIIMELSLDTDGVCILQDLKHKLPEIHKLVSEFISDWQLEFKDPSKPLVLGGFGALGTPSSFHAPPIRKLNKMMYDVLMPMFMNLHPCDYVTSMFNRFCIRYPGTSLSGESAHRDEDPLDGFFYGGWLNTGSEVQRYTCMLGSHNYIATEAQFKKLTEKELEEYKANRTTVLIQPGELIIFKSLKHEIHPHKCKAISTKIWHSYFISHSRSNLLYDPIKIAKQLSVPRLPSNQRSPMYAKLHFVNWKERLREFSANIRDDLIDPKTGFVYRFFDEVPEKGRSGLPEYTREELKIHRSRCLALEWLRS